MKPIPVPDILARRSVRRYTDQLVGEEQIQTLLEAGMGAPSAGNLRPWHFIVITQRETLDLLAELHPYAKMLHQAPLCIAVCGDLSLSPKMWVQDCCAATQNILLAATGLGLGTVWVGVHPNEGLVKVLGETLGVLSCIRPLCLIAIGYPAERPPARTQYDPSRVHRERFKRRESLDQLRE